MNSLRSQDREFESVPAAGFPAPVERGDLLETTLATLVVAIVAGIVVRRYRRHVRRFHSDAGPFTWSEPVAVAKTADVDQGVVMGEFWDGSTTRFCPVCRAEYVAETLTCEDCAVDLVDEDEVPEAEVEIQESIVRVARVGNSIQGQLVREFLSVNRIPCAVQRCSPWDVLGADLYVLESDALRAKKLIRHFLHETGVAIA